MNGYKTSLAPFLAICALAVHVSPHAYAAVPADASKKIVGAWTIDVDESVGAAIYQFSGDGKFTLSFEGRMGGNAGGNWVIRGNQLAMTNTWSEMPFTVVGETETAELIDLTDSALKLRTTNLKGQPEVLALEKMRGPPALEKRRAGNPNLPGSYRCVFGGQLLVLAADGTAVVMVGGIPLAGQWVQSGNALTIRSSEVHLLPFDSYPHGAYPAELSYRRAVANFRGGQTTRPSYRLIPGVLESRGHPATRPTGAAPSTRPAAAGAVLSESIILYRLPPANVKPSAQPSAVAAQRVTGPTTRPGRATTQPASFMRRTSSPMAMDIILEIDRATGAELVLRERGNRSEAVMVLTRVREAR